MSAWSGLRPLVRDPNKKDTKSLARNHIIEVSESNLITIAGNFICFVFFLNKLFILRWKMDYI